MNERIKELAEQAYQEQDPELLTNASRTFEHGIWLSGYSKKFAELIVKECCQFNYDFNESYREACEVNAKIREHFGVE